MNRMSIVLMAIATLSFITACNGNGRSGTAATSTSASSSATEMATGISYHEVEHDGRLYIIGRDETLASFKQSHHLPYTKTLVGDGPEGQTVVIEIDKKDEAFNEALFTAYRERHPYYREVRHDGRLYVIGSQETMTNLGASPHLAYTKTLVGDGPNGETVIIEIDKKDESFNQTLFSEYRERHPYYREVQHDGRIYVIGKQETMANLGATPHLPYTRTLVGDGPNGETVIIEIDKKDESFNQTLFSEYRARNPYYREVEHDGRIYIIGSAESMVAFGSGGHLPYTKTFVGRGPDRQTLIFEIDKKDKALTKRLIERYNERHGAQLSF